jgi:septal ring factor EnvC (AmiA/AmiB activator)
MAAAADPAAPVVEAQPPETIAAAPIDDNNATTRSTDGADVPFVASVKTEDNDNVQELGEDDDDTNEEGAGSPDVAKEQKKRKERLEQNRISARESRKRKKTMIEELQRTVITLSKENKDLNDRNEQLRSQLVEIGRKVRRDVFMTPVRVGCTIRSIWSLHASSQYY